MRLLTGSFFSVLAALPLYAQFLSPDASFTPAAPSETSVVNPQPVAPAPAQPAPMIMPASADSFFHDFAAYAREKNVILTWHLVSGRAMDKRMQIYRFTEEPRVIHDISRGTLIAKLTGEINLYEDVPPARGGYYYAIFVETSRGLEPGAFTPSRNLVGPVNFGLGGAMPMGASMQPQQGYQRPDFGSYEVESQDMSDFDDEPVREKRRGINSTIRRTYLKGNYAGAVKALKPYLRNGSPQVRAKAMFYTGLARYRLEQYEKAIQYFEHPLTQKYYRRNAEFWINRTSENLR